MGFVTDFYKISRSNHFKYLAFCHAWIDYEKEEDIIQVGEVGFLKYLRMNFLLWNLKKDLKKAEKILSQETLNENLDKKLNPDKKVA